MVDDKNRIIDRIAVIESRLQDLALEKERITIELESLKLELAKCTNLPPAINAISSPLDKISLFRSLFRGREDVYPKLWMSKKTGAKGYTPVCENEWVRSVCRKPQIKCGECDDRQLSPVTDDVIRRHLDGHITAGIYPLLPDETCYFLAADFDKASWQDDAKAFLATGPYIGEGFDDPRLDTLFLVMPFSFKGKMVQYAGRLHRKYEGKTEVRIYDYADPMPILEKMYKKRLKAYKALGYVEKGRR
jgi:hypothetical protein